MVVRNSENIEREILGLLGTNPMFARELVKALKDKGLDEAEIRDTLWKLLDQRKIRLGRERQLEAIGT